MTTFADKQAAVCDSKIAYLSEFTAKNAAWLWRIVYGTKLAPYKCPVCGDWHLTSKRAK